MFTYYDKLDDGKLEKLALRYGIAGATPSGYDRQYVISRLRERNNWLVSLLSLAVALLGLAAGLLG